MCGGICYNSLKRVSLIELIELKELVSIWCNRYIIVSIFLYVF